MQYINYYSSPLGEILLAADECGIIGLWFEGQKHFAEALSEEHKEKKLPIFERAKRWLDIYFSGKEPCFSLPLHLTGTSFQITVLEILCTVPYGETLTYGELAKAVAKH